MSAALTRDGSHHRQKRALEPVASGRGPREAAEPIKPAQPPRSRCARTTQEPARRSTSQKSSKDTNTTAASSLRFTADELKALDVESSKVVDLETFVPRGDIDPVYLDSPYYLYPNGAIAVKALRVISATMTASGVAGVGRLTLSRRERM